MESDDTWLTETLYDDVRLRPGGRICRQPDAHQRLVVAELGGSGHVQARGRHPADDGRRVVYHEMLAYVPIRPTARPATSGSSVAATAGSSRRGSSTGDRAQASPNSTPASSIRPDSPPESSRGAFDDQHVEIVLGDGAVARDRRAGQRERGRLDRSDRRVWHCSRCVRWELQARAAAPAAFVKKRIPRSSSLRSWRRRSDSSAACSPTQPATSGWCRPRSAGSWPSAGARTTSGSGPCHSRRSGSGSIRLASTPATTRRSSTRPASSCRGSSATS